MDNPIFIRRRSSIQSHGDTLVRWQIGEADYLLPEDVKVGMLREPLRHTNILLDDLLNTLWQTYGAGLQRPAKTPPLRERRNRPQQGGYRVDFVFTGPQRGNFNVELVTGETTGVIYSSATYWTPDIRTLTLCLQGLQRWLTRVSIPSSYSFVQQLSRITTHEHLDLRKLPEIGGAIQRPGTGAFWATGFGSDIPANKRCYFPVSCRTSVDPPGIIKLELLQEPLDIQVPERLVTLLPVRERRKQEARLRKEANRQHHEQFNRALQKAQFQHVYESSEEFEKEEQRLRDLEAQKQQDLQDKEARERAEAEASGDAYIP